MSNAAPTTADAVAVPRPVAVEEVKAAPNRRPLFVLGFLIVAVVGAIGIHSMLTADEESTDDAQVEADVVPLAARVSAKLAALDELGAALDRERAALDAARDAAYAERRELEGARLGA